MKSFLKIPLLGAILLTGCASLKGIPVRNYRVVFEIQKPGLTTGWIANAAGEKVATLWQDRALGPGPVTLLWDGRDSNGDNAPPGEYRGVLSLRRWELKAEGAFGGLGSTTGRFLSPQGLCAFPQGSRLTVAVADTGNNRVQLLTDTGGFLQAAGDFGSGIEKLSQPTAVDWDGQFLTVCDSQNHRLARFDPQGNYLGEVRQLTGLQTTITRQTIPTAFEEPKNIKKDSGDSFWVSDPGQGMMFLLTSTGGILKFLGNPISLGQEGPFYILNDNFFLQTRNDQIEVLDQEGNSKERPKPSPPSGTFQEWNPPLMEWGWSPIPTKTFYIFSTPKGDPLRFCLWTGYRKPGH